MSILAEVIAAIRVDGLSWTDRAVRRPEQVTDPVCGMTVVRRVVDSVCGVRRRRALVLQRGVPRQRFWRRVWAHDRRRRHRRRAGSGTLDPPRHAQAASPVRAIPLCSGRRSMPRGGARSTSCILTLGGAAGRWCASGSRSTTSTSWSPTTCRRRLFLVAAGRASPASIRGRRHRVDARRPARRPAAHASSGLSRRVAAAIAVCRYSDGIGHPFWLGRAIFGELWPACTATRGSGS